MYFDYIVTPYLYIKAGTTCLSGCSKMKKILLLLCIAPALSYNATRANNTPLQGPVVPNVIADKYVAASAEHVGGLLGERMTINLEKRLLQIDSAILLSGFRKRPGSQTWIGEHVGKFLFSASKTYQYSHDPRIRQLMDAMVKEYIKCQLPDGYLGTYLPKDYWTDWDVWAHKYAIIGLLNYYSVTGYAPALETAKKAADLICRTFGDEKGQRDIIIAGHHAGMAPGSILEPMVDIYRYTGDKKYLAFCEYLLRAYEHANGPKIISSLEKYGTVTSVGNAKAYEMMSCFLGILKYYKLTGNKKYLEPMETAWRDIRLHRMYITGTASEHECFKEDDMLMAENDNKMGEGCVTTTWIQFNLQLLQITGDQKYAEELERSVYNHLFAAENPQTGCVSYYTALQGAKPYRCDQGFSCCLSSVPRAIALIPEMVWGTIDNTFSVLMFENGEVSDSIEASDGRRIAVHIKSSTSFPDGGKVEYTVTPSSPKTFTIQFRVPGWSNNFRATVDGKTYNAHTGQFAHITRKWKAGDKISVSFEMPLQLIPGGTSYPDKIAFKRGPQVLAIDQSLNRGVDSLGLITSTNNNYTTERAQNELPGDWQRKQAYSLTLKYDKQPKKIILVPFAEAGQSGSNLEVWISSRDNYSKN